MSNGKLVGSFWEHYRNKQMYQIQSVCINPNTNEEIVVYATPSGEDYWRPYLEFIEKFTRIPDGMN